MHIDTWHFEEEDDYLEQLYQQRLDKVQDLAAFEVFLNEADLDDYERNYEFFNEWRSNLTRPVWEELGFYCMEEMVEQSSYGT